MILNDLKIIIIGSDFNKSMAWFHLVFGILLFVVFTQTGACMRADFPDKEMMSQELRVLMRSRHIYILFSALIHISLGAYFRFASSTWRKAVQIAGSAVLLASSALLFRAFVVETYTLQNYSDLSRFGIYASLAGVALHLIGGVQRKN